jgi:formylglycine-generating enzyme required for sulfatase activity
MKNRRIAIFLTLLLAGCGGTAVPAIETAVPPATPQEQIRPADGMTMIYVPGGAFHMGSTEAEIEDAIALCRQHYNICNRWYYQRESPRHAVSLDNFLLDQTEITNAQYRECVAAGDCAEPLTCKKGKPTYADTAKAEHPVVCVSWDDAQSYCRWAGARLPTEAEWEYAFRGEMGHIYPWGDSFDGARLNYCDVNCDAAHGDGRFNDTYAQTAPTTSHPNDISWSGARGMGGNVSEWVADWFGDYTAAAATNPIGPPSGGEKIVRGGSWFSHPTYCRGAIRASIAPDTRFNYVGFRCAASME